MNTQDFIDKMEKLQIEIDVLRGQAAALAVAYSDIQYGDRFWSAAESILESSCDEGEREFDPQDFINAVEFLEE